MTPRGTPFTRQQQMQALRLVAAPLRQVGVAQRALSAAAAEEVAAAGGVPQKMVLNFTMPHGSICVKRQVDSVTIPSVSGEYGVTPGHTPVVAQLKPGVVQIYQTLSGEPERYFVSAGFAVTYPTSVTDIAAVEAVKLDQIDPEAAKKGLAEFKIKMDSSPEGSVERAKAQISFEVYEAMCVALGLTA